MMLAIQTANPPQSTYIFRGAIFILVFSNFLAISGSSYAQSTGLNPKKNISQYIIDAWTVEDGLTTNSIQDCELGPDGYLWFATYDGLVRFDGISFKSYDNNYDPAFSTNSILALFKDSVGMWIGTNGGGLILKQGESFIRFDPGERLQGGVITDMESSRGGGLWLGSRGGLVHFKDSTFTPLQHPLLGVAYIYDLATDAQGNLWVATAGEGVFYQDGEDWRQLTMDDGLPSNSVRALYPTPEGTLWIGTVEGAVPYWGGKLGEAVQLQDGLPSNTVNCFLRDRQGNFWIGTDEGLVRYQESTGAMEVLDGSGGLSHNTIEAILEDPEGNLWLGTYRGGINRIKDGKFFNYGMPEGFPNDVVNVTYADGGVVWIGTDNGLVKYQEEQLTTYSLGEGPDVNRIRDIFRDSQGRLWLCSYLGLLQFDGGRVVASYSTDNGLSNNRTRTALEDGKGNIWVGTANGLNQIGPDGEITVWGRDDGLDNDFIMSLFIGPNEELWVGSNGGGIYMFKNSTILNFTRKQGLQGDVVFDMYKDSAGNIWAGTGGGLSIWRNQHFEPIGTQRGLQANGVFQIAEDAYHHYWVNTDRGVMRIGKEDLLAVVRGELEGVQDLKVFADADGMRTRETTGASHMGITPDGRLWVPTLLGVTVIDPQNIPMNTQVPPVNIQGVYVDQHPASTNHVVLPSGQHRIVIEYTALTFSAPESVDFRYIMEGFDSTWVEAGSRRETSYTNLPPGNYTFRVIARNNDNVWNTEGAVLTLHKQARFVQTIYFYLMLVALIGGGGIVVYYVRLATLNARNQMLTNMVQKRTENIQQQNEAIRQQAEELEMINTIVQTINQEIEMEGVLEALLTEAMKLFPQAERAAFLTFNDLTHKYEFSAVRGMDASEFQHAVLTPQEAFSTFGEDYQELEGGVYLVKNFRDVIGKLSLKQVKSSLVMTIKLGVFPEGFLFLFNSTTYKAFDKSDSSRLKRFRDHALSAYSKAKVLQELKVQKRELELYFQNMNDSVQYARRIQEALLPPEDMRYTLFPESFLFFRPKDVVSGDFYWYGLRNGMKILAVVDCTGHGVPGAFMSVLGNSLLNQIINERGIVQPAEILNQLNRLTRRALGQYGHEQVAMDGMDVALCVVDEAAQKLYFAGAKRPLYFFRDQELHVIKGDNFSIGGLPSDPSLPFTEHVLSMESLESIYVFSDGYYDQFSGETGKKFMVSRFKNLIREIKHLPMPEQQEMLEKRLKAWKGLNEQVDDILVIGVKL